MPILRQGLKGIVCVLGLLATACASHIPTVVSQAPPAAAVPQAPAVAVQAPAPPTDPVVDAVTLAEQHFQAGEREFEGGRLEAARSLFDRAIRVMLDYPGGARSDARLTEQLDRMLGRINGYEMRALADAAAFMERMPEPAPIDDLLAITAPESPASPEIAQTVANDLDQLMHDIEIPLNSRVLSYVQLFTGRLKGYLEEGLSRGAPYLPMIQSVFRAEGLPLDLAYVPLIESAFKPNAVSRAKATGMWQFMRGTALENGLQHDWYIDERADPEKATRAAAKYLKVLYGMFGDWHLALASYNGGPGRVQRAMKGSGRNDFWKLSSSTRYLPRETRDYVPLILAAIVIARNPLQYEMNVAPFEPPAFETITLPTAIDLRRVAEWAGTQTQQIQELNPELRRWTTPLRATGYELKVPEGTADLITARLAELEGTDLTPVSRYTVKKGETLLSVAKKLKVTRTDLAEANYLTTRSKLSTGQRLIVPRPPALLALRTDGGGNAEPGTPEVVLASQHIDDREAPMPTSTTHRVQRGDTLFSIARRYGTTVANIKQWNDLSGNVIKVGQRLVIERLTSLATN